MRKKLWRIIVIWGVVIPLLLQTRTTSYAKSTDQGTNVPIPVFAYYYIWFEPSSWHRAKIDYPLLGRYSSDDQSVMRQHIIWAKQAGIDGFIVSWKSTEKLNWRLEQLVEIAEEEGFKLMIIYQGLTFERQSRPIDQIASDFDFFIKIYAHSKAFDLFTKPLLIWNGTTQYSREEVKFITKERRDSLLILAAEKSTDAYLRLADLVDGNAYYWSSGNPRTYPGYQEKLDQMGITVHQNGGIWIPSAAPGFDARQVEGERVIDREDGEMLRLQMESAFKASPDVIGLISWNEFSENTHIEPSEKFGMRYLDVLTEILNVPPLPFPKFDTSDPVATLDPGISKEKESSTSKKEVEIFQNLGTGRVGSLVYLLGLLIVSSSILIARRLSEK